MSKDRNKKSDHGSRQRQADALVTAASQFVLCQRCMTPHEGVPAECEQCGLRGRWVPTQHTQGMTLADLRRFAKCNASTANRTAVIAARWVASFFVYTAELDDPRAEISDEVLGLFWVRLHGVVAELPEHLAAGYFAGMSEEQARAHHDPNAPRHAAAHAQATSSTRSIGELLNRDQHIYAEWRRHTECHLQQSAFRVQVQGKIGGSRSLKAGSSVKGLPTEGQIGVEDLNAAIRRVLAAHGGDDLAVGRALATKIRKAAGELYAAWGDLP